MFNAVCRKAEGNLRSSKTAPSARGPAGHPFPDPVLIPPCALTRTNPDPKSCAQIIHTSDRRQAIPVSVYLKIPSVKILN